MSGNKKGKSRPWGAIAAAVTMLLILCAGLVHRPVLIHVYRLGMDSAFAKVYEVGVSGRRQSDYFERYERCRDRLVQLGYLAHREFFLQHIQAPTEESRRLWELLIERFPDNPHTAMDWYREPQPMHIEVWDRPERVPEWEKFIADHDVPDFLDRFSPAGGTTEEAQRASAARQHGDEGINSKEANR